MKKIEKKQVILGMISSLLMGFGFGFFLYTLSMWFMLPIIIGIILFLYASMGIKIDENNKEEKK
jgi:uncharacterized membrane protein